MASTRNFKKDFFRCYLYEAEDVLADVDDVDLIALRPAEGFESQNWWYNRLVYRDFTGLALKANHGLQKVTLTQDYDVFIAVCQFPEDLAYINAVSNWKSRCKVSVCWLDEIWIPMISKFRRWLEALKQFDFVFIGSSSSSVEPLSKFIGKTCRWLPCAVDAMRFSPAANAPARTIDVFSMGRRVETMHAALLEMKKEIFYIHQTFSVSSAQVFSVDEHRDLLAEMSKRSKYFVVAPAKFDMPHETLGYTETGPRFYEGAMAGCVLIGQPTGSRAFRSLFDWPEIVVEMRPDGTDTADVLRQLQADPAHRQEISQRNATESLLRHDWSYRWLEMLRTIGLEPTSRMHDRHARLKAMAGQLSAHELAI